MALLAFEKCAILRHFFPSLLRNVGRISVSLMLSHRTIEEAVSMGIVLRVISGPHSGQELSVEQRNTFTVGRRHASTFRWFMIRRFERAFPDQERAPLCHLVDLGSTNGTKVNGLRSRSCRIAGKGCHHGRR